MTCPEGFLPLTTMRQQELTKRECLLEIDKRYGRKCAALCRYHWTPTHWNVYCPQELAQTVTERN